MSLFTSNFKTEAKVVGVVILFITCIEVGVHFFERRMAVGLHTPKAAENLSQGEGRRVLILGNSLVRDGIETKILEDTINRKSPNPVRVEKAFLASATASDWFYIFKHSFVDAKKLPETLVLCFANVHLEDAPIQRPYIAHYYAGLSDIQQIFRDEIHDFDGQAEFLLFAGSLSFSQRMPLQRRVHDVLIPHYRAAARRINQTLSDGSRNPAESRQKSFQYFERLIKIAREHQVKVILLAMPSQKAYSISPPVDELIKNNQVTFLDNRKVEGLTDENFNDEAHLNDAGKKVYSLYLGEKLLEQLGQ